MTEKIASLPRPYILYLMYFFLVISSGKCIDQLFGVAKRFDGDF